jgi:hypothetical protein
MKETELLLVTIIAIGAIFFFSKKNRGYGVTRLNPDQYFGKLPLTTTLRQDVEAAMKTNILSEPEKKRLLTIELDNLLKKERMGNKEFRL